MPLLSLLALGLLCWLSCGTAGAAEPTPPPQAIWSGLVFATNNPKPAEPPPRLRRFTGKLRNIFGYNQYQLVGEYSEKVDPNERWLTPGKDFSLSVRAINEPGKRHPARIVLFQNRRRLAEFEAHLNPESPLFIRGPQYAGGQLVIVLHAVDPSEVPERGPRPVFTPVLTPVYPPPVSITAPPLERERLTPLPVLIGPPAREKKERLAPYPDDRFGPMMPLDHRGDLDSKYGRP